MTEDSTGLSLDRNFDFEIDSAGDIKSVSGVDELQKDLSGLITNIIDNRSGGSVLTENKQKELESRIRTVVSRDPRVTAVNTVSLEKNRRGTVITGVVSADSIYGSVDVSN